VRGTFEEPPTGLIPWLSKTEGNTYATIATSPFPLQGKPTQAQDVATAAVSGAGQKTMTVTKCWDLATAAMWTKASPLPAALAARQASAAPPLVTAPPVVAAINHRAAALASRVVAGHPTVMPR